MATPIFGFSGVGKSTYAKEFPRIAIDMNQGDEPTPSFITKVLCAIFSDDHKYVFMPCDQELREALVRQGIAYVVILPMHINQWVKRWLKAGDSADSIKRRVDTIAEAERAFLGDPVIYLYAHENEWIGNALSQYGGSAERQNGE